MISNYTRNIFLALESACLMEGGDGDTLFISPKYKEAADFFELWLKDTNNGHWERNDRDGYITFHNMQECIYFSDKIGELDYCAFQFNDRYSFVGLL